MSIQELIPFKEKFNLSDDFIQIVESLFDRLVFFGYIGVRTKKKLIKKLLDNVDDIYIGNKNTYDYKSGYYDANKKIIYIKNEKDVPAIYLRLLYAMTSRNITKKVYTSGFSTTKMRLDSYKLEYSNFGINRAIMANLVCKLCDTLPVNIGIVPTYKSYTHNFLGYTITANNDIYALEGKILSELCYVLNIDENIFYAGLFSKDPIKYLNTLFRKKRFEKADLFLNSLDNLSLTYSRYNKLTYLSKLLNDNYIEIKKNILNNSITKLEKEKKKIENELITVIQTILPETDTSKANTDIDEPTPKLSEVIDFLEDSLHTELTTIQDILADDIISSLSNLSPYIYASKLHQFYNMLIEPNKKIKETVRDIILYKLIPTDELMATNIIQKIRYSIVLDLLSNDKFTDISKNFSFHYIQELIDEDSGKALVIVTANKSFARMLEINGLNNKLDDMKIEVNYIPLDNLKYIMNSDFSNMYVNDIEKLYTSITTKYDFFKNISLENMYLFEYLDKKYVILYQNGNPFIANIEFKKTTCSIKFLEISQNFKVFESSKNIKNEANRLLPVVAKKRHK